MRFWTPGALYTALIVVICVVIVQFHAITFWSEHAAYITGWLWAIGLEMLVLWLWFQRRLGYQLVGVIGTTILLAGPVYTISADLVETLEYAQSDQDSRQSQIDALKGDIERMEKDLATFRANSEERTGWLPIIRDTQQEIAATRVELRELQSQRDEADTLWLTAALLVVQVIAVVLFHIGAILGITWLSKHRDQVMEQRLRSMEHPTVGIEDGMEQGMEQKRSAMEHPPSPRTEQPPSMERMEQPAGPMEHPQSERMEQGRSEVERPGVPSPDPGSEDPLKNTDNQSFPMEHPPVEPMEQLMEHPPAERVEHPAETVEQSMEHPPAERMEHPTESMEQPMEHPSAERMEHPAESMEQPKQDEARPAVLGSTALQSEPSPSPAKGSTDEIPLAAILRAVEKLQRHLDETDDTISRFADRNGIPRRDVSLFLRHKENLDAGKRCASMSRIRAIMAAIPE